MRVVQLGVNPDQVMTEIGIACVNWRQISEGLEPDCHNLEYSRKSALIILYKFIINGEEVDMGLWVNY